MAETLRLDGELGSQFIARLPDIAAGILIVLISFRVAMLIADLAGASVTDTWEPAGTAPPVRNVVDVPSVLRANLFGQSPPAAGQDAPATSMPLVLLGVVAATDEKGGYAMIGSGTLSELKKVGDPLSGGATLHAVHVDRVLLSRGGIIESLALPEFKGVTMNSPMAGDRTAASIQRVEQAIRSNPSLISQVMNRTAVIADGRLRGLRVSPGPNAAAFTKLGLRNGDIVTAVNGVQLNDEARSREIFDSLSGAAEARVTVERNGTMQDLVLNLAEIANEAEQVAAAPPPAPAEAPPPDAPPGPDIESAR